jgi:hypothetical protein
MRSKLFTSHVARVCAIVNLGAIALGAGHAAASFTKIENPWPGEPSQAKILAHLYGGTFAASGVNFSNGSVTATRVDDTTAGFWHADIDSINAVARFTRNREVFGFLPGVSGGKFMPLFKVTGTGFNVTGNLTSSVNVPNGTTYRFARTGGDGVVSSLPADNGGVDHLVSYAVSGTPLGNAPTFLLFFEDNSGGKSDFDFNDLVVKITTPTAPTATGAATIPLPPAYWMGISGIAVCLAAGALQRLRRTVQ